MINPFDDNAGTFCILVNQEKQYSLWPTFKPAPAGWKLAGGPDGDRETCLAWIDLHWKDMRPASLVAEMSDIESADPDRV